MGKTILDENLFGLKGNYKYICDQNELKELDKHDLPIDFLSLTMPDLNEEDTTRIRNIIKRSTQIKPIDVIDQKNEILNIIQNPKFKFSQPTVSQSGGRFVDWKVDPDAIPIDHTAIIVIIVSTQAEAVATFTPTPMGGEAAINLGNHLLTKHLYIVSNDELANPEVLIGGYICTYNGDDRHVTNCDTPPSYRYTFSDTVFTQAYLNTDLNDAAFSRQLTPNEINYVYQYRRPGGSIDTSVLFIPISLVTEPVTIAKSICYTDHWHNEIQQPHIFESRDASYVGRTLNDKIDGFSARNVHLVNNNNLSRNNCRITQGPLTVANLAHEIRDKISALEYTILMQGRLTTSDGSITFDRYANQAFHVREAADQVTYVNGQIRTNVVYRACGAMMFNASLVFINAPFTSTSVSPIIPISDFVDRYYPPHRLSAPLSKVLYEFHLSPCIPYIAFDDRVHSSRFATPQYEILFPNNLIWTFVRENANIITPGGNRIRNIVVNISYNHDYVYMFQSQYGNRYKFEHVIAAATPSQTAYNLDVSFDIIKNSHRNNYNIGDFPNPSVGNRIAYTVGGKRKTKRKRRTRKFRY